MSFSYANPTSGPSAGGIGWFDFGNLTINPGDSVTGLTGTLNDGSIVTFNLSLTLVSGMPRQFDATTVPTYSLAQFGNSGYTGLSGNVAIYAAMADGSTGIYAFSISNITVRDPLNNPIPNYTVLVGDAETTHTFEGIQGQTNGGSWSLFATVGGGGFPTLTGVGSQTFNITGNQQFNAVVSYVLATQAPNQIVVTLTDLDPVRTRQGFVIGFATTRVTLQKNIGQRIDPSDQFRLDITGNPSSQASTTGTASGIQTEFARVYATPGTSYNISEAMAIGSSSLLSDYILTVSPSNATPAGSIPPVTSLPIQFTPALGDDVTYTFLNAAPETFQKTVDKAYTDVGGVLTYEVTVDNPNDFAVSNVLVTDATPDGTTYIGSLNVSAPYTGTDPATGITITTIPPASSVTLSWRVQVNSFPPVPNPVPNYANVTVPGGTSGMTNVVTTQVNLAYVSILKMTDKAYAVPGEIITYTLMLSNAGNVSANQVIITDPVPAGTTLVPGSVTGATGTPPSMTLIGSIPAGGTSIVTFQVRIDDSIPNPNPVLNSAGTVFKYTVDPADPDGATRTTQSNTVSTLVRSADITTTKTVDKAYADTGELLTYTLVLQNNGNTAADNVIITDSIPAGTVFVPGSVTGATGTPPSLALTAPIAAGNSAVVSFQVMTGNTLPVPNPVPNTAAAAFTFTVDPSQPDGADGTSTSNTVNTQVNHAAINTTKAVDKAFANTGDVLTYTLLLQNDGNTAANNIVITDVIPPGTTYIAGSLTGADGAPPLFALANPIPAGGSKTVTFQVLVGDTVPVPNPVANSAATAFTYTVDPAVPDGAAGTGTSNTVKTQINTAALTTTKAADKTFAGVSDVITYTITLQNNGNVTADHVVLTDAIPAGTTFIPGSLKGAAGAPPVLTLNVPVPAGGSAVVSYQVQINGLPQVNPIPNTASVSYVYTISPDEPGGGSGNGKSNTVTTLVRTASLSVVKGVNKNTAYPGDTVTYRLAVTNNGNTAAQHVILTDNLPNGLVYVSGSLTGSVPVSGTPGAIMINHDILPGETVIISFQAKITAVPLPNPAINQAVVNYDYPVDPGEPNVPGTATSNPVCTRVFRNRYSQQITDIIESAALDEAALSAIVSAEGAKIQKMAAMNDISVQELLCLNNSVNDMMESVRLLEAVIRQKLSILDCQMDHPCF